MKIIKEQLSELVDAVRAPEWTILEMPGAVVCLTQGAPTPESRAFSQQLEEDPELKEAFLKIRREMQRIKEERESRGEKDLIFVDATEVLEFEVLAADSGKGSFGESEVIDVESMEKIDGLKAYLTAMDDRVHVKVESSEEEGHRFVGKVIRWRVGDHRGDLYLQCPEDGTRSEAETFIVESAKAMASARKMFWLIP